MRVLSTRAVRFLPLLLLLGSAACAGGYDSDHDGVADDLGHTLDTDGNGDPDLYDINWDGTLDGIGVDTNDDGIADGIAVDTDKDGLYESIATKDPATGQEQMTRSQLVPLPAPVYAVGQDPKQP